MNWGTVQQFVLSGGVLAFFVKEWWTARTNRKRILKALRAEAEGAATVLSDAIGEAREALGHAAKLKDRCRSAPGPDFRTVNELPAGWVLYIPPLPWMDVVANLKPDEAKTAIAYMDAWTRLGELEKRYRDALTALLAGLPISSEGEPVRMLELADRVLGELVLFGKTAEGLLEKTDLVMRFDGGKVPPAVSKLIEDMHKAREKFRIAPDADERPLPAPEVELGAAVVDEEADDAAQAKKGAAGR